MSAGGVRRQAPVLAIILASYLMIALETAGTVMLALALALVIALIVRPGKAAHVARHDPIGPAAPASDTPARGLTEALTEWTSAA
jgi:hypothetical protein